MSHLAGDVGLRHADALRVDVVVASVRRVGYQDWIIAEEQERGVRLAAVDQG